MLKPLSEGLARGVLSQADRLRKSKSRLPSLPADGLGELTPHQGLPDSDQHAENGGAQGQAIKTVEALDLTNHGRAS